MATIIDLSLRQGRNGLNVLIFSRGIFGEFLSGHIACDLILPSGVCFFSVYLAVDNGTPASCSNYIVACRFVRRVIASDIPAYPNHGCVPFNREFIQIASEIY